MPGDDFFRGGRELSRDDVSALAQPQLLLHSVPPFTDVRKSGGLHIYRKCLLA
jgi:hypothetical protein